ncbi:hypothetical protein [Hydrogenimonas sp.]
MKKNPGSLWLLILLLPLWLHAAADYRYSLEVDKESLYAKEPLLLRFTVWQTDPSKMMFFSFKPLDRSDFFIKRIDKVVENTSRRRKAIFTYLLYPLKSGTLTLHFDLVVKRTNEARIALSTTGGRYNVKDVETEDSHENVEPKTIYVKPLPAPVDLVGDFTLITETDRQRSEAYKPVYMTIRLKGRGFPPGPGIFALKFPTNVEYFSDAPKIIERYTKKGIEFEGTWSYALVSSESFTVPPIKLKAFSASKEKLYELSSPAIPIEVVKPPLSQVMAPQDSPESTYAYIERIESWGRYLFIFLCGFISALLYLKIKNLLFKGASPDLFQKEVKSAKDAKELLVLLVRTDVERYAFAIDILERAIYFNEPLDLKEIKKEILKSAA